MSILVLGLLVLRFAANTDQKNVIFKGKGGEWILWTSTVGDVCLTRLQSPVLL